MHKQNQLNHRNWETLYDSELWVFFGVWMSQVLQKFREPSLLPTTPLLPNCSGKETLLASPPCVRIIHKGRRQVNLLNKPSPEAKIEAQK